MKYLNKMTFESAQKAKGLCKKYSDEPEKLETFLESLELDIREVGIVSAEKLGGGVKRGLSRYQFEVTIYKGSKSHCFDYFGSIKEWEDRNPTSFNSGNNRPSYGINRLYSVLTCIKIEYYCPETWDDFVSDFGSDSHESYKNWERWLEHSRMLKKFFTEEEVSWLPI